MNWISLKKISSFINKHNAYIIDKIQYYHSGYYSYKYIVKKK